MNWMLTPFSSSLPTIFAPLDRARQSPDSWDRISKTVSASGDRQFGNAHNATAASLKSKKEENEKVPWTVFNRQGQRKYLTSAEVDLFVRSAKKRSVEVRTFCLMLVFTGCRISEALSLTVDSIDFESEHVIIRCLKKRGKQVFRTIPLPPAYLKALHRWCDKRERGADQLWPWSRMTGYRRVREVMYAAGVRGGYASPKGLRHAFGVRAIQASVPLTLVQKWLGHADIKTTAIYTNVIGPEEREIASRMWKHKAYLGRGLSDASAHPCPHREDGTVPESAVWEPAWQSAVASGVGFETGPSQRHHPAP